MFGFIPESLLAFVGIPSIRRAGHFYPYISGRRDRLVRDRALAYDIEGGSQDLWIFDVKKNIGRRLLARLRATLVSITATHASGRAPLQHNVTFSAGKRCDTIMRDCSSAIHHAEPRRGRD